MSVSVGLGQTEFQKQLAFGQIAESQIAKWIISRGGIVLPIYDVEYDTGKGPRLFAENETWIAPDLLIINKALETLWIEAKHKTVFTWHRNTGRWTTGIDLHHYTNYLRVAEKTPWPVWLLFLHCQETPDSKDRKWDCPATCPVGLFGETIDSLSQNENHRHKNWGRYGMVYWAHDNLKLLASIEEVNTVSVSARRY